MRLEQGIAKVFTLDTKTNQMAVMPLDPGMFPALINIYVIGALIPLVFFVIFFISINIYVVGAMILFY